MRKPIVSLAVTLTTTSSESQFGSPVIEAKKLYGFFVLCVNVALTSERCPAVARTARTCSRIASREDCCAPAGPAASSNANKTAAILGIMPVDRRSGPPIPFGGALGGGGGQILIRASKYMLNGKAGNVGSYGVASS